MDIEELNKSQIVLLTLLVSFVTSIATGIVTVSLMQQAPPAITQTVNRVVEHTVEKIVPGQSAAAAVPVTETRTVVVNQSDAIASAVAGAAPSVVRLYASDAAEHARLLGLGLVVDRSGIIATDAAALGEAADAVIDLGSTGAIRVFVYKRDAATGLAFMRAATTTVDGSAVPAWTAASLPKGQSVLGQDVVALSGKTTLKLGQGIISGAEDVTDAAGIRLIETDVPESAVMPGTPLIDTTGAVVGLSTGVSRAQGAGGFISSSAFAMKDAGSVQQ